MREMVSILGVALSVAGCGPSATTSGSSEATGTTSTTGSTAATSEADTAGSASSSAPLDSSTTLESTTGVEPQRCPDNVALDPFCYRRYPIEWSGSLEQWRGLPSARYGSFGPDGDAAWLLYDEQSIRGLHRLALATWNGDGFRIDPWGELPDEFDERVGPIAARMLDGVHSDLVVGQGGPDAWMGVVPWGRSGPGSVLIALPPDDGYRGVLDEVAIVDIDLDGRDEVATATPAGFALLRASESGVEFWGEPTSLAGLCGYPGGTGWGDIDGDGAVDLATTGVCTKPAPPHMLLTAWGGGPPPLSTTLTPGRADEVLSWAGVADLDGDSLADLVYATVGVPDGAPIRVGHVPSRGDRTFEAASTIWEYGDPGGYHEGGGTHDPFSLAFMLGDVDGDGADDVVFTLSTVAITGVGRDIDHRQMFDLPWHLTSLWLVSSADVNADGRLDFLVSGEDEDHFALVSAE